MASRGRLLRLLVLLADGRTATLWGSELVVGGTGESLGPDAAGVLTLYHGVRDAVGQVLAAQAAGYRFAGVPELEPQQARAGRVRSARKADASRANGPRGGRPRKGGGDG